MHVKEAARHEVAEALARIQPPQTGNVKVLLELHYKDGTLAAVNCEASVKTCRTGREFSSM